jgi:hypothetical protein
LKEAGQYLAGNNFGYAVIVVSAGSEGDTQKQLILTEVRALAIRDYLVQHFGFDDSQVKTLGLGRQTSAGSEPGSGTVQLLIFPVGSIAPSDKVPPASAVSKQAVNVPSAPSETSIQKP